MKTLAILSFIMLIFGIAFSIHSPYIHIGFLEGPAEPQKDKVETKSRRQISSQNMSPHQVIVSTKQISSQRTPSPQTRGLSLGQLVTQLRSTEDDFYKLKFIRTNIVYLRHNLSGSDLVDILGLFSDDNDDYRVDAIEALKSRLNHDLSMADLVDILGLFSDDYYRADATSALQSRLNPNYSDSDYRRFSELFTDDFYGTRAANSLQRR